MKVGTIVLEFAITRGTVELAKFGMPEDTPIFNTGEVSARRQCVLLVALLTKLAEAILMVLANQ